MDLKQLKMLSAVRRLTVYWSAALDFRKRSVDCFSPEQLAESAGLPVAKVKDDFALLSLSSVISGGSLHIDSFADAVQDSLTSGGTPIPAVLVCSGCLGKGLMNAPGVTGSDVKLLAVFTDESAADGVTALGTPCFPLEKMFPLTERLDAELGILCVPHKLAPACAGELFRAGIRGLWNWSGCDIDAPEGIPVLREDFFDSELKLSL